MNTPPKQPGDANASKASNESIGKQLDDLLSRIEEVEPGTIDPAALPYSFRAQQEDPVADEPIVAEAEIQALLDTSPPTDTASPEPAAAPADAAPDAEQADMLATLNSALQGLSGDAPLEEPAEPATEAATEAPAPAAELSMEEKLQQEIAALMATEPPAEETPATAVAAETAPDQAAETSAEDFDTLEGSFEAPENLAVDTQANEPSIEEQIAMEIDGLLNTDEPATEVTAEASSETAIDELDKMLAQEIDEDDELAGDFQSVEDLTAGIPIDDTLQNADQDEHAATAREVAAELDSQPEDLPAPPPAAAALAVGEDPAATISELAQTAEKNEEEHDQRAATRMPDWQHWLAVGQQKLLNACYLINWPARRFLTKEWRETLGLISLMFTGTSTVLLIFVLLFS